MKCHKDALMFDLVRDGNKESTRFGFITYFPSLTDITTLCYVCHTAFLSRYPVDDAAYYND